MHAGSLVAALASWLDARAHGGQWLVRIEDVDTARCTPAAAEIILGQLARCGLLADEPPVWQSTRTSLYQSALARLVASGQAYPCACSRRDIESALATLGQPRERHRGRVYPGTCRGGLQGRLARSWRFRVDGQPLRWHDRRLGSQQQDVGEAAGDFVLLRADGCWAYQLAVVVDDAAQGISDVVRGEDLADNTPRQILLQRSLAFPTPRYLHAPLVLGPDGEKLSKQNGAAALDLRDPLAPLNAAARVLGLPERSGTPARALAEWVSQWRDSYNQPGD